MSIRNLYKCILFRVICFSGYLQTLPKILRKEGHVVKNAKGRPLPRVRIRTPHLNKENVEPFKYITNHTVSVPATYVWYCQLCWGLRFGFAPPSV